jgi:hypothetical protein
MRSGRHEKSTRPPRGVDGSISVESLRSISLARWPVSSANYNTPGTERNQITAREPASAGSTLPIAPSARSNAAYAARYARIAPFHDVFGRDNLAKVECELAIFERGLCSLQEWWQLWQRDSLFCQFNQLRGSCEDVGGVAIGAGLINISAATRARHSDEDRQTERFGHKARNLSNASR